MFKPFLIILTAICFSVSGELLLKSGMTQVTAQVGVFSFSNLGAVLARLLASPRIITGFGLFGIGAVFWLAALSRVPLSWAYPMLSIGYLLILLFSWLVLKEHVSAGRWLGALVICVGIVLVFRSGTPR
jgi:multidrug transporter EmrE-like cation transporter